MDFSWEDRIPHERYAKKKYKRKKRTKKDETKTNHKMACSFKDGE